MGMAKQMRSFVSLPKKNMLCINLQLAINIQKKLKEIDGKLFISQDDLMEAYADTSKLSKIESEDIVLFSEVDRKVSSDVFQIFRLLCELDNIDLSKSHDLLKEITDDSMQKRIIESFDSQIKDEIRKLLNIDKLKEIVEENSPSVSITLNINPLLILYYKNRKQFLGKQSDSKSSDLGVENYLEPEDK